jgi:hypothetical protein
MFNLRETSCFGVFLPAVQDFGRRVWQEKGYMRNCCLNSLQSRKAMGISANC